MEVAELKLANKGNCLFCKAPSVKEHSLRTLLQYLQMTKVHVEMKVEPGEREGVNFITVDLEGPEVKAGLCEECGGHLVTFMKAKEGLEMAIKACLAPIQSKMEVGRVINDMTTEYSIQEGEIVKEALTILKTSQPRVLKESLQLPETCHDPPADKIEVDEEMETTEEPSMPIIRNVRSVQSEEGDGGEVDHGNSTANDQVDAKDTGYDSERSNQESSTSGNDFANEVLREKTSLWKPTFGTVKELVSGKCGTRFSRPDEIARFMEEMKGKANPLPNGTVIFIPRWNDPWAQQVEFQAEFCKFLDVFKDNIFHLVYVFNLGAIQTGKDLFNQFRSILELKNLRSLVIDKCEIWEECLHYKSVRTQIFELLASKKIILPVKLAELHVHGLSGSIPLSYMFGGIESILKSVSSLEVSNNGSSDVFPLCLFPNLQKLKVSSPDAQFLQQFLQFKPNSVASLKEISIFFESEFFESESSWILFAVKETFELLDIHAETLEFLHLDFEFHFYMWELMGQVSTSVKYTKLKALSLQFDNLYCWLAQIRELMSKKFVNLQELRVIFNRDFADATRRKLKPSQPCEKVVAFWDLLPATVESIHIPAYGWKLTREDNLRFNLKTRDWEIVTSGVFSDPEGGNEESLPQAPSTSKKRKLRSSKEIDDEEEHIDVGGAYEPKPWDMKAAQSIPRGSIITLRKIPMQARKSTGGIARHLRRR